MLNIEKHTVIYITYKTYRLLFIFDNGLRIIYYKIIANAVRPQIVNYDNCRILIVIFCLFLVENDRM